MGLDTDDEGDGPLGTSGGSATTGSASGSACSTCSTCSACSACSADASSPCRSGSSGGEGSQAAEADRRRFAGPRTSWPRKTRVSRSNRRGGGGGGGGPTEQRSRPLARRRAGRIWKMRRQHGLQKARGQLKQRTTSGRPHSSRWQRRAGEGAASSSSSS
jgi:hypothetical protein